MSQSPKTPSDPSALEHLVEAAGAEAASLETLDPATARGAHTLPWHRLQVEQGHNPRTRFDRREIERLADSIRERGLLQPIVVRPAADASGRYLVTAGERRYRALGRLIDRGEASEDRPVPVVVRDDGQRGALLDALLENLQRSDLHPLDEADAYAQLRDEHAMTTAQIAETLGITRRTVQLRLQLRRLSDDVRAALRSGEISFEIARVLAGAPAEQQTEALERYRKAPPEHQNADSLRAHLRARAIPYSRALFDPRTYTRGHDGAVYDGGKAGKFFTDHKLFRRLQRAALTDLRSVLQDRRDWVEVIEANRLPPEYEEDDDGPGAVLLIRNGLYDIEVFESVRRTDAGPPSGSPADGDAPPTPSAAPSSETTPAVPLADLRDALTRSDSTALRLAVTALLSRGGTSTISFALPPRDSATDLGPRIARPLQTLARELDLGEDPEDLVGRLADPRRPLPDEHEIYRRLARLPAATLHQIHAALVALSVSAHRPSPLLRQLAQSVGVDTARPERPDSAH